MYGLFDSHLNEIALSGYSGGQDHCSRICCQHFVRGSLAMPKLQRMRMRMRM